MYYVITYPKVIVVSGINIVFSAHTHPYCVDRYWIRKWWVILFLLARSNWTYLLNSLQWNRRQLWQCCQWFLQKGQQCQKSKTQSKSDKYGNWITLNSSLILQMLLLHRQMVYVHGLSSNVEVDAWVKYVQFSLDVLPQSKLTTIDVLQVAAVLLMWF